MLQIDLILVPTFYGCDIKGVDNAPFVILDYIKKNIVTESIVNTIIIDIPKIANDNKFDSNQSVKYYDAILETSIQVKRQVVNSIVQGRLPITIGGDHSVSIGSLAGSVNQTSDLDIIWIDAHGDINTTNSSPSKNAHGMVLSNPLKLDGAPYADLFSRRIMPSRINYFGVRDLDPFEQDFISTHNIHCHKIEELVNGGVAMLKNEFIKKNIHLSIDIDVLDPIISPGTGVKVANGMSLDTLLELITQLIKNNTVIALDFVEFNPILDIENKTFNSSTKVIETILRYII